MCIIRIVSVYVIGNIFQQCARYELVICIIRIVSVYVIGNILQQCARYDLFTGEKV